MCPNRAKGVSTPPKFSSSRRSSELCFLRTAFLKSPELYRGRECARKISPVPHWNTTVSPSNDVLPVCIYLQELPF